MQQPSGGQQGPDPRDELQRGLQAALAECARLREENSRLRALLGLVPSAPLPPVVPWPSPPSRPGGARRRAAPGSRPGASGTEVQPAFPAASPADWQVALFQGLFRGREDVYAVRWESRGGRSGYSPACRWEWNRAYCGKPQVKCAECEHREFLPLTDEVIRDHLAGKRTVGVYPLLLDETCWFLAVDFDKASWREDVAAFLRTCDEMSVPAALERSRSGNGAHVWIFFGQPVPARLARNLGCALLTRTMERRHQLGLDSYDRFFPNQDTMPRGGFGNLIALPLQGGPARNGNTLFLDGDFRPYADQWEFLSELRRTTTDEVEAIVREAVRTGSIIGVRASLAGEDEDEDPWTLPPSRRKPEKPITGPLPEKVGLVLSDLVYVEKEGLPSALLNRLVRLAAFQNPEFYRAQAMRLSTFGKPRVIACAEEFSRHVAIPRGCLEEALALFRQLGIRVEIADERFPGRPIDVTFRGGLRPSQEEAAAALLDQDIGILSAGTAFGKTVVAVWLIAARKVNTLVLVHRRHLLDQWKERLGEFLGLPQGAVGEIGGGRVRPTGVIDVALIQSLGRKGEVRDLVAQYGQVIVDECHHLSAFTFEQVLKRVRARYVVGLTATPTRRDGHHPIVIMQCGPVRFRVRSRDQARSRPFKHVVMPRRTEFRMPPEFPEPSIQDIYTALAGDPGRNELILSDLLQVVQDGRSPLLLTERTEHVEYLAGRLAGLVRNVFVLRGGMGAKHRREVAEQLGTIPDGEERVLVATGRYIGEGFDDARLDTLFLAMPVSWRGVLEQYAGRLHRLHEGKRVVMIYDYVDVQVPVLVRMYRKRVKGYRSIGYSVGEMAGSGAGEEGRDEDG
ncbi:MAG TPA: DEAD/DEAH box helicase family protein [Firmicutes bacterium]|nr:DEAD/DEAH box helicase family protein [Bacillota bacterium]